MEGDEDRLAPRVHGDDRLQQRVDHEIGAKIRHAVEGRPVGLDPVQHALDDLRDAVLELLDAPRRERRHQQAADAGMLLAVHLRHELRVHDLVERLPARPARHFRREGLGIGEHLVHIGVAADDHLRRPVAQHIERRPPRPFGHVPVRVGFEVGAAEIDVDDVASVEIICQ